MLAARGQENLPHLRQAAVGKQTNSTAGALGPKTPHGKLPKTPFRTARNDENEPYQTGKSAITAVAKGKGRAGAFEKQLGLKDGTVPVTPIAQQHRAPLGAKTTNAKARPVETALLPPPAARQPETALKSALKSRSPRLRRSKLKVHHGPVLETQPAAGADESDVEVEYCPPKPLDLPDLPTDDEDFSLSNNYRQLEGDNFLRGLSRAYFSPVEENGVALTEEERRARARQAAAKEDRETQDRIHANIDRYLEELRQSEHSRPAATAVTNTTTSQAKGGRVSAAQSRAMTKQEPSVMREAGGAAMELSSLSKSAAAALSQTSFRNHSVPSFAAPTAASLQLQKHRKTSSSTNTAMRPMQSKAEKAAAKLRSSTMGYSKGRAVSAYLKKAADEAANKAEAATGTPNDSPVGTESKVVKLSVVEKSTSGNLPLQKPADQSSHDSLIARRRNDLWKWHEELFGDFQLELPEVTAPTDQ